MSNGIPPTGESLGSQPNIVTFTMDGSHTSAQGPNGQVLGPFSTSFDYDEAIEQMALMAFTLEQQGTTLDGLGIATPALIEDGQLIGTFSLRRRAWKGAQLQQDMANKTGIPAENIVILQEAEAGAIAEQEARSDVGLGFFVDVSGSFNGSPYSKSNLRRHPIAPKVALDNPGHEFLRYGAACSCGKHGCIQAFASGHALRQGARLKVEEIPADDGIWDHFKMDLVGSVASTIARYKNAYGKPVEVVSLCGSVVEKGPDILGNLRGGLLRWLGKETPEIVEAKHGSKSALAGARIAVRRLLAQ